MNNLVTDFENDDLRLAHAVVGSIDTNVYVIQCKNSNEALLIDAPDPATDILSIGSQFGATRAVATHGHKDHVGAVPTLLEASYTVYIGQNDRDRLQHEVETLNDGQVLTVGEIRLTVYETPGHTPGSVCLAIEGVPVLLTGDTLFPGGPGATKFKGGDFQTIIRSIRRIFETFGDETQLFPGHGASTTIGTERPFLQEWIDRGW